MSASKYWIAVASAEHVRRGRTEGFTQVSHGKEAPVRLLLANLGFTAGKANWGYQMRFGLFEINAKDFRVIAKAVRAAI
jgi:hypothetical protein